MGLDAMAKTGPDTMAGDDRAGSGAEVVVSVDIGTSGVRCLAYTDDFRVVATTERDLETRVGADGRSTHSWDDVRDATLSAIQEIVRLPALEVAALSLSGTASCLAISVAPGATTGRDIREVMLWSDTRAAAYAGDAAAAPGSPPASERERAAERFARTLCPDHLSYWPAKLRWADANHPLPAQSHLEFGSEKDFLFELLTGHWWVDPMTAAATGIFDSERWEWDRPSLTALGLREDQLPQLREATSHAPVLPGIAEQWGLPAGLVVVIGGMDGPLAQVGAAGFSTDAHTCTVGTSIAYRAGTTTRTADPARRVWCYPVDREFWVVGGAGSNGGNVLAWLSRTLGRPDVGALVGDALQMVSDPELLFLPYFHGERAPLWSDDVRGTITGLAAHHGGPDIARAALDGIGAVAIELASAVTDLVGDPAEVRLTGGFLRDESWPQLVTDALGVATFVPEPDAATSTGAAVIGWLALGRSPSAVASPAVPRQGRAPDPLQHQVLASKASRAARVREALRVLPR